MNKALLILTGFQTIIVIAYLHAFLNFPENYSADFISHVRISTDVAKGGTPPLILYGAIEYYLAFAQILFGSFEPLLITRYAMAFLVCLSPTIVYYTSKEFFDSAKIALLASAMWIVTGYVWFAVFGSGLYPNFLGILVSFALLATTSHFVSEKAWFPSLFLVALTLILALFSHYSTLLIFPSLLAYLLYVTLFCKHRSKGITALAIIITPLVVAFFAFPGIVSTLFGFLNAGTQEVIPLTWLASSIPLPVIQYMISEIAAPDPFRTDVTPVATFILLLSSVYQTSREKNPKIMMILGWFLTSVIFAPLNQNAWRFAYAGLPDLTILSAHGLYWLKNFLFIKQAYVKFQPLKYKLRFRSMKALPCLAMIVFLLVPGFANSWTVGVIYDVSGYNIESLSDSATYQTIQWLKLQPVVACGPSHNRTCQYVTPTDGRLTLSALMGGPNVVPIHPYLAIPETVSNAARNFSADYVIVSRAKTIQLQECTNPAGQIISLDLVSQKNDSLVISISSLPKINSSQSGPFQLLIDGKPFGRFIMENGIARLNVEQLPSGAHDLRARFGFAGSNILTVFINENKKAITHEQIYNYCDPWYWQMDDWGGSAYIAYENEYDKVWCISNGCAGGVTKS